MKTVYFDNNATTKVAEEVFEEIEPLFCELYGNPSSMHTFGGQIGRRIRKAREQVAGLLGCEPSEIVFTGCGTESDNTAIKGTLAAVPNKRTIITTRVEHPAVLAVCRELENHGYTLVELSVDKKGRLDMDELEEQLDDDTALVTIMYANNETGVVFPIEDIAELVKSKGAIFHTDAVQAVGKIPMKLSDLPIDMLSLSGHKLHAPKGIGALYVRSGVRFSPMLVGGHQEGSRRGGTEAVPSIVALGRAAELARDRLDEERTRVQSLRDRLERELLQKCPDAHVNGNREHRLPNTLNISFEYIEGEAILLMLNEHGICASSGSACTTGSLEPSHVLRAMGVPYTAAHGSIRFSLSVYNTDEEIAKVIEVLPPIIRRLREMSPFGRESRPAAAPS
jgi:cysteine desulfurase